MWAVRGNEAKEETDSDEKKRENEKEGRICSLGIVLTKELDCQERKDGAEGKQRGLNSWAKGKDCGHMGSPNSGLI